MKFVETASYVVDLMLLALRDYNIPSNLESTLSAEAQHGLQWLLKMWNDKENILYYQVGIGELFLFLLKAKVMEMIILFWGTMIFGDFQKQMTK